MSAKNEYIIPSTLREASVGTLPFLAYGTASLIDQLDLLYPSRFA